MSNGPPAVSQDDVVVITLDALRFDVAANAFRDGRTPYFRSLFPDGWQERHSPGNFTFAAHAALFAGFWPTPVSSGRHERPFALQFAGSRTIGADTTVLSGQSIVEGFRALGYYTICIGGVGFFDRRTPLGSIFPSLFDESHWQPSFGVNQRESTNAQVLCGCERIASISKERPLFFFLNVSATHPPTRSYLPARPRESVETQAAALEYVDRELPPLFKALRARRRSGHAFVMSDHGTLFGEEGHHGHRVGHRAVWTVPYAETTWKPVA